MLTAAFAPQLSLKSSSRVPAVSRADQISAAELLCLLVCGALSAAAVGLIHLRMGVPGHAILRAVLPMAMGLALVPRRSTGMVMSLSAGITSAVMNAGHVGHFPPAAILSILALGPILDLSLAGARSGWRLYARFAAAGALANLFAFALRAATSLVGLEMAGSRQFLAFWPAALASFVLCGAVAGLISAAVWFRLRGDDDLRRS